MSLDPPSTVDMIRRAKKRPLWPLADAAEPVRLGHAVIERLIPHRPPMLLVDEITALDLGQGFARGRRTIREGDLGLSGHFPGQPIYPGVLQVEMMGQLGLCLLSLGKSGGSLAQLPKDPPAVRAIRIEEALFLAEVRPGDELNITVASVDTGGLTNACVGQLTKLDGTITAVASMEVYFVD